MPSAPTYQIEVATGPTYDVTVSSTETSYTVEVQTGPTYTVEMQLGTGPAGPEGPKGDPGADGSGTVNSVNGVSPDGAGDVTLTPGSIGAQAAGSYATAAQGALADTAVQPARTMSAGSGLTGGGDLSADRSFAADFGTTSGKVAQGNDSRFVGVGITDKSASYTLAAADAGTVIRSTAASAITITVPNSTFSAGQIVEIVQYGVGQVTIAAGSGVTLRSTATTPLKTSDQYATASLLFLSASEAIASGELA